MAKSKRFFIQGTADLHKRLQHLAIELNTSAERLAGEILGEFIAQVESDVESGRRKPRADGK